MSTLFVSVLSAWVIWRADIVDEDHHHHDMTDRENILQYYLYTHSLNFNNYVIIL